MNISRHIVILLCLVLCTQLYSQQNPFDLNHRLDNSDVSSPTQKNELKVEDEEKTADSTKINYRDSLLSDSSSLSDKNEMIEEDTLQSNKLKEKKTEINDEKSSDIPLPEVLQEKRNLIFATFLILLIMLTLVISFNRSVVDHVIRAFMNDNYLNLLYREQRNRTNMQHLFLYFFFVANIGFFVFLSMDYWLNPRPSVSLLTCILIIGLIYFIRYLTMEIISSIFPVKKEAQQFSFTITIFNILLGLIFLPINLFLAFAPGQLSSIAFYVGVILFILFYIFRQLRGLFIAARLINSSQFHFFIYLCTVEIGPLLVGAKIYLDLTS